MFKRLQHLSLSVPLSQIVLGISCLLTPSAFANPFPTTPHVQANAPQESVALEAPSNSIAPDESATGVPTPLEALKGVPTSLGSPKTKQDLTTPVFESPIAQENTQDSLAKPSLDQPASDTANPDYDSKKWHFKIQPYLTLPLSTYGTNTIGDRSLSYSLSLGDVLGDLNFALYARAEAWHSNLGFILDASYQNLGGVANASREARRFQADLSATTGFSQGIYDFAVSYHFGAPAQFSLPEKPTNRSFPLYWFEPILGARLNALNASITARADVNLSFEQLGLDFQRTFQRTVSRGRTWLEPMVGAKIGMQVSDPITLWLRGDVSGFGLAGTPDLSYNIFAAADWWISRTVSSQIGYRFYGISYGNNDLVFNQQYNGPYLGVTFNF
jgi:hypothetical protein